MRRDSCSLMLAAVAAADVAAAVVVAAAVELEPGRSFLAIVSPFAMAPHFSALALPPPILPI